MKAQSKSQGKTYEKGFYLGIKAVLVSSDRWNIKKNDLNLIEDNRIGFDQNLAFRPVIGYRFTKIWRAELAYWYKDYVQGVGLPFGRAVERYVYDANLFTARLQVDLNVCQDIIYKYPSLGLTYGSRIGTLKLNNTIDQYESIINYDRKSFTAVEFGLGTKVKFSDNLSLSVNLLSQVGLSKVTTVEYYNPKLQKKWSFNT